MPRSKNVIIIQRKGNDGGGTPKAFGVDLLQISIPWSKYDLTDVEFAEGLTVKACALPFLDKYVSDLVSTNAIYGNDDCGVGLALSSDGSFSIGNIGVHSEMSMIVVNMSEISDFFIWKDGKAYIGTTLNYAFLSGGYEFFILKAKPTVPEIDDGGESGE